MARDGSTYGKGGFPSYDTQSIACTLTLVEEMTNAELVQTVENEKKTNRQIFLENDIFEKYLHRVEATTLANMDQQMAAAAQSEARQQRLTAVASRMGNLSVVSSTMSVTSLKRPGGWDIVRDSVSFIGMPRESRMLSVVASSIRTGILPPIKEGPTIIVSHKMDMCTKEMDELRMSYERLTKLYRVRKAHLNAEIEEMSTMLGEINNTSAEFEEKVIINGVEELTKKIPASVFVRFMEEWFRKRDLLLGQLRLKTDTYRNTYKRISQQLEEKIELGETLRPVDFEFQEINRIETTKQLHAKNFDLNLLKKETTNTHREFVTYKVKLAEKVEELANLKMKTSEKEDIVWCLQEEERKVRLQVLKAAQQLNDILHCRNEYTVPGMIVYAKAKDKLQKLEREMRVWNRRSGVQHKQLTMTRQRLHQMKVELGVI